MLYLPSKFEIYFFKNVGFSNNRDAIMRINKIIKYGTNLGKLPGKDVNIGSINKIPIKTIIS